MIFEKVKSFFGRFWQFLFKRKEFWQGVEKESFRQSLGYCLPLFALYVVLVSSLLVFFGQTFLSAVFVFMIVFGTIFSFLTVHLALRTSGGKGSIYNTIQVFLYHYLYYLIILALVLAFFVLFWFLMSVNPLLGMILFAIFFGTYAIIFIFSFVSLLQGFSTVHKISKLNVFVTLVLLWIVSSLIVAMLFSSFLGVPIEIQDIKPRSEPHYGEIFEEKYGSSSSAVIGQNFLKKLKGVLR